MVSPLVMRKISIWVFGVRLAMTFVVLSIVDSVAFMPKMICDIASAG